MEKYHIDLGCGGLKKEGCLGVDIINHPSIDYIVDLSKDTIPLPDDSVEYVYSSHFLEHIDSPEHILKELSRVCCDGAKIEIWTPYLSHDTAFYFSHKQQLSEDLWKQFCLSYGGIAGVRWQLERIRYIMDIEVLCDMEDQGISVDFALQYYKNTAHEFCVFICIRKDIRMSPTVPKLEYALSREGDSYPLEEFTKRFKRTIPPKLLVQGTDTISQALKRSEDKKLYVFGTGAYSDLVLTEIEKRGGEIAGYFDNKRSGCKNGCEITRPEYKDDVVVLVATLYSREVIAQLYDLGYDVDRVLSFL